MKKIRWEEDDDDVDEEDEEQEDDEDEDEDEDEEDDDEEEEEELRHNLDLLCKNDKFDRRSLSIIEFNMNKFGSEAKINGISLKETTS